MTANDPSASLRQQLGAALAQRGAELRSLLATAAPASDAPPDVIDFKDVAAEESRAQVDEAAHAYAREELARVTAALRRVADGSYGLCQDCGEPIDARRLQSVPATPYCTPCQAARERSRRAR